LLVSSRALLFLCVLVLLDVQNFKALLLGSLEVFQGCYYFLYRL
jgi:hypothetical protein